MFFSFFFSTLFLTNILSWSKNVQVKKNIKIILKLIYLLNRESIIKSFPSKKFSFNILKNDVLKIAIFVFWRKIFAIFMRFSMKSQFSSSFFSTKNKNFVYILIFFIHFILFFGRRRFFYSVEATPAVSSFLVFCLFSKKKLILN